MEKRNLGEVITMFLVGGYLDEYDIIPVLKKGTAKMMCEKEEKIFTQPLQKESEWEKEFDEKFWIYFVQYYPDKENGLFGSIKSFIYQTIANRENEIAEEVEKLKALCDKHPNDQPSVGGSDSLSEVLSILKH